jgi:flagellar secretion chaperone FliS
MYRDAYLETEVLSASPIQLVEILYRAAIESTGKAIAALEERDIAERARQISRAQVIVSELAASLDHSSGVRLSQDLVELYDYMQRRLAQANIEQQAAPLYDVQRLLITLLEAWTAISSVGVSGCDMSTNDGGSQFSGVDLEGARLNSVG